MREAFACCRAAGTPKKTVFLDQRSCLPRRGGDKPTKRDNCDKAGRTELRQAVDRIRAAEVQPSVLTDKKHLLLKTGEIKWCWRCGARTEGSSAPRVLLKTA